jgi:signal transduction histidine kinase
MSLLDDSDYPFLRQEIPSAIHESLEGLGRVTTIVRAMKDFSHPGADCMEATDLNRSILSTIEVCRNRWKYVADLQSDLAPDLPLVACRVAEFNQVVLNLIVNASDAIADAMTTRLKDNGLNKGLIRVSTRLMGDVVEVRVSDNGNGIPDAAQAHMFEPFFTTKAVGQGTGQGLALAWRVIVNEHSGKIFFETQPGSGTTFVIQLPVKGAAKAA